VVRRDLTFGALAVALVVLYMWGASQLAPVVGPAASSPTPTPTRPAEQTGVPRVPGAIAFVLRGDVYLLRDGRYAPLTSEGRNSEPALSADGATLYFVRREQIDGTRVSDGALVNARLGYSDIVRKPAGGGTEEIVVTGLRQKRASGQHAVSWFLGPALSTDARRLAVFEDDGDGAADLEVIALSVAPSGTARPTTTAPRATLTARPVPVVLSQGADLADASWSPDGKTIAVTSYNTDTPGILLWSADKAGIAERLKDLPQGETYRPAFSPDGRWLLYTLRKDGKNDLHAYELSSKRDVALTSDGRSWSGVLSPDGAWLAFLRERGGTIDLYAMELGDALSGGKPKDAVKLTRGEGIDGASRPSWSR
jgi:Tol biopolymer transport system component